MGKNFHQNISQTLTLTSWKSERPTDSPLRQRKYQELALVKKVWFVPDIVFKYLRVLTYGWMGSYTTSFWLVLETYLTWAQDQDRGGTGLYLLSYEPVSEDMQSIFVSTFLTNDIKYDHPLNQVYYGISLFTCMDVL